jgi:AraC family transcriptional regulator of adaptative response / DNA-3-methyladenine glycosylase II
VAAFQAVVTTGIYCRPDCTARPNAKNVVAFESQAAAEAAGFRACLRCRPYRVEADLGAVGPDLVCRAIHRIVDGALDDGRTEDDLARDLHVSARHLRRLFVEHVGTTPDGLARSRRAHFARRLLDDTDLRVRDIAQAAGFGSVRQLNRACKDVFRATPTELRARRRKADRLQPERGVALRVPLEGARGQPFIGGIEVDGELGHIEVTPMGDHLLLVADLPRWSALLHVVHHVRRQYTGDTSASAPMPGAPSVKA